MNSADEFDRLYDSVCGIERAGFVRSAALATITRTAGSTFRHAGSSMLIHEDGQVVCALSGGCPQHDIVERARRVIRDNAPELALYNRDSSLDVLLEMGCGGELEILIEPLGTPRDLAFLHALAQLHTRREPGFMATVYARNGAVLAPRPQRLVHAARVVWNDIDNDAVVTRAVAVSHAASTGVQRLDGALDMLLEVLRPQQLLVLVGINAVSLALAAIAASLGWKVMVVENAAAQNGQGSALPHGATLLRDTPGDLRERLAGDAWCAVVVMTFKLEQDLAYLAELARLPLSYLGAIGSRERSARMRAMTGNAVRLHAPAGLDIGADNPQEIALSIAAEIMAQRSARNGASLSSAAAVGGGVQ